MISIQMIQRLKNNDGLTLKSGKAINYKTGWQVAFEGIECEGPAECLKAVKEYNGDCGIWFADGIYYVDKSKRVKTKREALKIGRENNQISIFGWAKKNLVYC